MTKWAPNSAQVGRISIRIRQFGPDLAKFGSHSALIGECRADFRRKRSLRQCVPSDNFLNEISSLVSVYPQNTTFFLVIHVDCPTHASARLFRRHARHDHGSPAGRAGGRLMPQCTGGFSGGARPGKHAKASVRPRNARAQPSARISASATSRGRANGGGASGRRLNSVQTVGSATSAPGINTSFGINATLGIRAAHGNGATDFEPGDEPGDELEARERSSPAW